MYKKKIVTCIYCNEKVAELDFYGEVYCPECKKHFSGYLLPLEEWPTLKLPEGTIE